MLNTFARASICRFVDPVGGWLSRAGIGPDAVTVTGAIGTVASALWFFPRGQLVADGALFAGLTWWCFVVAGDRLLAVAALFCLVSAQVISYIKARAAASGLSAEGGMAERAERYIITLVGACLTGLGVPFALDVALWILAGLQLVTVTQRMLAVRRSAGDREVR
ncbi:MAG: phosphatidylinositol phosphate synthase [Pseudonocardiaceae bacterium]